MQERLETGLRRLQLKLLPSQHEQLLAYLELLAKWNKVFNLSAVRDPDQMVSSHLLDSLAILPYLPASAGRILDVGTGAGLPGLPLAITQPQRHFTLLDSSGKKTRFLTQVKIELGLTNLEIVQQRVEDYSPETGFDAIVSRAFAALADFIANTDHLLAPGGSLLAMKAKLLPAELEAVPKSYRIDTIQPLDVPFLQAERHLIIARPAPLSGHGSEE